MPFEHSDIFFCNHLALRKICWWPLLMLFWLAGEPSLSFAGFDEFSEKNAPTNFTLSAKDMRLIIKGKIEFEFHDIEGQGGPGFDSMTDTKTIKTRSPYVEIDSFWLALRLELGPLLSIFSVLEFDPSGARIGGAWLDSRFRWPHWLEHHLEIGLHTPFIKIDRRTERYPIIASVYWRSPEFHMSYEGLFHFSKRTSLELGFSLSIMRPLTFVGVQESTSQQTVLHFLAYGAAQVFSGNAPSIGSKIRFQTHGFYLTAFGFMSQLSAESGTDQLRGSFPIGSDELIEDRAVFWGGGRVGYDGYGIHVLIEAIASQESLLKRWGGYAQISYTLLLRNAKHLFHAMEALVRIEMYQLIGSDVIHDGFALRQRAVAHSATWDYQILTFAFIVHIYRDILRLRLEYYVIEEINGIPEADIPHAPIKNNEFLAQLEVRF
jgi:hypothetical protein